MNSRFPVLASISALLKVVAAVELLVAGFIGLAAVQSGWGFVLGLLAGIVPAISLWAYAEIIGVALAIEENTFQTRQALTRLSPTSAAPAAQTVPPAPVAAAAEQFMPTNRTEWVAEPPAAISPRHPVHVSLSGFGSGQLVRFNWITKTRTGISIGEARADQAGVASLNFLAPLGQVPGSYEVTGRAPDGRTARTTVELPQSEAPGSVEPRPTEPEPAR